MGSSESSSRHPLPPPGCSRSAYGTQLGAYSPMRLRRKSAIRNHYCPKFALGYSWSLELGFAWAAPRPRPKRPRRRRRRRVPSSPRRSSTASRPSPRGHQTPAPARRHSPRLGKRPRRQRRDRRPARRRPCGRARWRAPGTPTALCSTSAPASGQCHLWHSAASGGAAALAGLAPAGAGSPGSKPRYARGRSR